MTKIEPDYWYAKVLLQGTVEHSVASTHSKFMSGPDTDMFWNHNN